jgi:hypothetical protein
MIASKTLRVLPHTSLTLTTLPWKRNGLLLGRLLVVTEYRQIIKSVWLVKQ